MLMFIVCVLNALSVQPAGILSPPYTLAMHFTVQLVCEMGVGVQMPIFDPFLATYYTSAIYQNVAQKMGFHVEKNYSKIYWIYSQKRGIETNLLCASHPGMPANGPISSKF